MQRHTLSHATPHTFGRPASDEFKIDGDDLDQEARDNLDDYGRVGGARSRLRGPIASRYCACYCACFCCFLKRCVGSAGVHGGFCWSTWWVPRAARNRVPRGSAVPRAARNRVPRGSAVPHVALQ